MFHAGQRGRTIAGEFFGDREARRGFGSSFGNILKFAFELKNMCAIFFGRKRSEAKRPTERGRSSKSAERGRGFKWRAPSGVCRMGAGRLSRRRYSCTEGRPWVRIGSGVARQVKGVILSEPGSPQPFLCGWFRSNITCQN